MEAKMISVRQFCALSNLGRTKTNQMLRNGRLASIKVDGRRLIFLASAQELLASSAAEKADV